MAPRQVMRMVAGQRQDSSLQPKATRGFILVTVIVITVLVAQLSVALLGALVGARESERAALDTFSYVGDITAERIGRHVDSATDVVIGTVVAIERHSGNIALDELAEQIFQRLEREPNLRAIYVGFPDGSYLEVRRDNGGYIQERIIAEPVREGFEIIHDADFAVRDVVEMDTDYDPRMQPWYVAGQRSSGTVWTEPFLMVDTQVLAASATRAARDNRTLFAVVGADLILSTLATVLDELPVGEGAEAFVLAPDRSVIAAPSQYAAAIAQLSLSEGRVPRASDLGITDDVMLVPDDGISGTVQVFGLVGGRYVVERQMPVGDRLNWVLHIEADETQLSPGLQRVQVTMAWVTGLSIVLALIAAALGYRIWQPLNQLRLRASTDALTGLSNRHDLDRRGSRLLQSAQRAGEVVVLIALDLDNFKALNDFYGHHTGDRALVVTGQALLESVRERDVAARLGGDEFVVVQRFAERLDIQPLVERIRANVASHLAERVTGGKEVGITAGYSVSYLDRKTLSTLMGEADAALIAGKQVAKGAAYGLAGVAEAMLPTHDRRGT